MKKFLLLTSMLVFMGTATFAHPKKHHKHHKHHKGTTKKVSGKTSA